MRSEHKGPDWHDILNYIKQLEQHHNATVTFELRSIGIRFGSTFVVTLFMSAPMLVGPGRVWTDSLHGEWPCAGHRTFEGFMYNMLQRADVHLAHHVWKQAPMNWLDGV